MAQILEGMRSFPKIIVALSWSLVGFLFFSKTLVLLLVPHLAVLPDGFAAGSIALVSNPGFIVLCGMLTGMISLLLWHPSLHKIVSSLLALLISILFLFGTFAFMMSDTQGVARHIIQAAESGNLRNTREQLLIQSRTLTHSKQLIDLGTNVNAQDPDGHSALFSASWESGDLAILKLLLESGAKPDSKALGHAISWGRLDDIKLMFKATSDDGKALIAELGSDALMANNVHTRTSEADRAEITKLLIARGAKPIKP